MKILVVIITIFFSEFVGLLVSGCLENRKGRRWWIFVARCILLYLFYLIYKRIEYEMPFVIALAATRPNFLLTFEIWNIMKADKPDNDEKNV